MSEIDIILHNTNSLTTYREPYHYCQWLHSHLRSQELGKHALKLK